ncbi:MAG TPA: polysaccharide biosynthesis/export family protein [Terriglobales bacterium]|nr:polysaccharide biosynthesis/export family protein [Terriglobales bacterium]
MKNKPTKVLLLAASLMLSAAAQNNVPAPVKEVPAAPEKGSPVEERVVIEDRGTLPAQGFTERDPRYRLRVGDVIELKFPFTPEFDQSVTVQPDGFITLREVGDTKAQGQSLPELRDQLSNLYKTILKDPVVRVNLTDFEKPFFIAGGEVKQPGKYDLRSAITVAEAVAIAGGFNEGAKHSEVLLFRRVSDSWVEVRRVNVKKLLAQASLTEDLSLHPGDMIYVHKTRFASLKGMLMPKIVLGPSLKPM